MYIDKSYLIQQANGREIDNYCDDGVLDTEQNPNARQEAIDDVIESILESVSSYIDDNLRGVYTVPLTVTDEIIKKISVELAMSQMMERRGFNQVDNDFSNSRQKWADSRLKDIRSGNISLTAGKATQTINTRFNVATETTTMTRTYLDRM